MGDSSASSSVSAVVYAGLFDAVTDVQLSLTTTGVKEDIVVHQYTGNHIYAYRLYTEGLSAILSGRAIMLYNDDGQCMAQIDTPFMTDATGNSSTDIDVSLTGGGGNYTITYQPNDTWMQSASYPVTIDPSGEYLNNLATGIGDTFVSSKKPDKHYDHTVPRGSSQRRHELEGMNLYAGNNGSTNIAYVLPALTALDKDNESVGFPENTSLLIDRATWRFNVHELTGDGKFRISLVTGSWDITTITYSSRPSLSSTVYVDVQLKKGWNEIDVTKLFSAWFNGLNQSTNYGFAVTSSSSWARICASDAYPRSDRMSFSATYYTGIGKPSLTAQSYGHGVNSGSGWVELAWTKVDGASGYVLGIYNGKEYEYQYVGNTTSYSTKERKLWPTATEIAEGSYILHWDSKGQELPNIPRADQSDLNYYFTIIPSNAYGQMAGNSTAAYTNIILPDTMPPNQPATVAVSPAGWTTGRSAKITWAGVLDLPLKAAQMTGGMIQYVVDPSGNDPAVWSWHSTGMNTANGTYTLDTSSWTDGTHAVYIRGVDARGNYGTPKGVNIRIDRTAPTQPTVAVLPSGWISQAQSSLSWSGISDLNSFRVEYQLDGKGDYTDTKRTEGIYSDYPLDLSVLSEGMHTIAVRGVDSLGNVGKSGSAKLLIDRSEPKVETLSVVPSNWTKDQRATLSWTGARDAYSGLKSMAYKVDDGAYQAVNVQENGTQALDISSLSDGTHTVALSLTDNAGIVAEYQSIIYIDRSAPLLVSAVVSPNTWTSGQQIALSWTGATDTYSGLAGIAYAIDGGEYNSLNLLKDGEQGIDITGLGDGKHSLTIQLTDYVGLETEIEQTIYVDRTEPKLTSLTLSPEDWTNADQVMMSWTGAEDICSGLNKIEYRINSDTYQPLETVQDGEAVLVVSELEDGLHTVTFKLTDYAGVSAEYTRTMLIDRAAPKFASVQVSPDSWSDTDTLSIAWRDAVDLHSGLEKIRYCIDSGAAYVELPLSVSAEEELDVSAYADGQHTLLLQLIDGVDNASSKELTFLLDRTPPVTEILSPADGATVSGVLDIQGTVQDISLKEWVLTAIGESGQTVSVAGGTDEKQQESLGVLDTSVFADGEEIEVSLKAWDEAGHETLVQGIYVKAVHQAQPVAQDIEIIAPRTGDILSETMTAEYAIHYTEEEQEGTYYVDAVAEHASAQRLPIHPILYPEDSAHTLTAVSVDGESRAHYSQGFQSALIMAETMQDEDRLESYSNIAFSATGAEATAGFGEFITKDYTAPRPMTAVRLHALINSGAVSFEYSTDAGESWHTLPADRDVVFEAPQRAIRVRCTLNGPGASLRGFDLTGIYEDNPIRWKAHLLKKVETFAIAAGQECTTAVMEIDNDSTAELTSKKQYVDGVLQADSFALSLLPYTEDATIDIAQAGIDTQGTLHGSGAATAVILREELSSTQLYESGIIALSNPVYAIRVEALCMDENDAPVSSGLYAYSMDGVAWRDLPLEAYTFLPHAAQTLYFRAILPVGVTLRGIHAEGVTLKANTFVPNLVTEPYAVQADDYGAFDADEQRYELQWNDDNKLDAAFSSTVLYDVYRNGELIASVTEKKYTDTDYRSGATYQVAARRVYSDPKDGKANILDRSSNQVKVTVRVIDRPVPPVVVTPTPAVTLAPVTATPAPQPQVTAIPTTLKPVIVTPTPQTLPTRSPSVNTATPKPTEAPLLDFTTENPYDGGSYGTEAATHETSLDLDQSLLGPHRFCSLGFEPVNFNTGNFFLQARDFAVSDVGNVALDLIRTYNSQSSEMDTPFGAKWGSEITQSLKVRPDGTVAWRRADGSEIKFVLTQEGGYASNSAEYEDLFVQENGYRILCTDGTAYVFDASGFLTQIEKNNGQQIIHLTRGEKGHLRTISMPSDREIDVQTDTDGHITKITLPGDMTVTYKYKDNNLVSVTDSQGQTIRYSYNKDALMTAWYDGNGTRQVQNTYDDQLRVIAQTDGNGGKYRLEYEDNRTITTDAEGNSVIYERDAMQRTTRIEDAMGGVTEFTYGEQGEIVSKSDPLGQITVYEYNENGDKITETDPRGASVRMVWDDSHHLLSLTNQNGYTTTYTYDEMGNLVTETAANGGVTTYAYDAQGQVAAKTDALGNVTRYEYTDGLLTKLTDPLGYTTVYTYDGRGNLSSMTDALGQVTQYEYDVKGNLLRLTFADGTCVCYTYDALGNQTSMTDPEGNVTKYAYDGLGNLIKTTQPDKTTQRAAYNKNSQLISATDALGGKTTYTYNANGNRLTVTDPAGNQTTSEYDAVGRLARETNALGGVTEYTYDEVGLPLSVTDPTGATQTMTYDLAGNLLTRTLDSGATISAEYDSMGNVTRQVNALGGVTEISYDLLGNITSVTDPMGARTEYAYDANGNLLNVTDEPGNITSYTYDALGRVVSETAPDGGVTAFAYDSVGNLVSVTDALGYVTRYAYDANGNLASMTDALGQTVTLSYDKNGNATAVTQKNGGVLATTYDKAGRAIAETDANGHTTRYSYNKAGQVASVTDAQGQKATFSYDALGNITKIIAPGNSITSYAYDTAGRTVSMADPEGCVTLYSYNEDSQIASVMVNGNETAYEYNAAGNVSAVTDAEGRRVTFAYDLNSNLTEILYPDGSKETTEYDALGRVIMSIPRTGLATAYLYDAMGNVISMSQGEQITTYEYDLLGRLVAMTTPDGSVTTYAYDALGNLISETDPLGNTTTFAYNAESLLELVTYANGATQRLAYDLAGNVMGETDAEGNTKQYRYDRVNRLTAVIDEAGRKTSYAYDAQDNIARVTDALGHVTRYTYDKNSNLLIETDALGNTIKYAYTLEGLAQHHHQGRRHGAVLCLRQNRQPAGAAHGRRAEHPDQL